jgi:hypothetical protein
MLETTKEKEDDEYSDSDCDTSNDVELKSTLLQNKKTERLAKKNRVENVSKQVLQIASHSQCTECEAKDDEIMELKQKLFALEKNKGNVHVNGTIIIRIINYQRLQ